ncbi:MAG: hypothetical protein WAK82_44275 [Streptosporangiaceae bacterium]
MSLQVIWEAQAIDQAAGYLRDDPDGVRQMLDAGRPARRGARPCWVIPLWVT